jgi:O-succinylbenzoic acid--CoA ligase
MLRSAWIETRARLTPGRTALEAGGIKISYADLHERAETAAARLAGRGVRPGDVVASLLEDGLAFVELLHAVDLLGAVLLPLNARLTARELAFPLGDSGARLLIRAEDGLAGRALETVAIAPGVDAIVLDDSLPAHPRPDRSEIDRDAPFAVLYTSGTTGRPKGACLSRANFEASAVGSALHLGVLPTDRWLACMPLFHVGGLSIPLRSAVYGTTAILHDRFDPEAVDRALDDDGITLVSLTATMLKRLLDQRGSRAAPDALRCVLLGGGPNPSELLERACERGFRVAPTYGLTEACSQVATHAPDDEGELRALTPLPGTEVRIVDDGGSEVAHATPGEIEIRGPTLMVGYLDGARATPAVRRDGWFATGDVGTLDATGRLRVIDRRSDLIVSGGENVYPAEVEAALIEHRDVAEAGVAGVADAEFGQRPAAWIVLERGAPDPGDAALVAHCRERLAGYKIPVAFRRVDALPRNASGKLLRRALVD